MGDEEAGRAQYSYLDGKRETREWCERGGLAAVVYPNGDRYEGHLSSARQREGEGCYVWTDEEGREASYRGTWRAGVKHGFGVLKYPNGDVYKGLWKDGKRHGQGTMRFANGDVFSGEWVDDIKHGPGAYVFSGPESQLVGDWQQNECVRGKWVLPDMSSYHGQFEAGKPIGEGVFYHRSGLTQAGAYVEVEAEEGEEGEGAEEGAPRPRSFRGAKISVARGSPAELVFRAPIKGADDMNQDVVIVTKREFDPNEAKEEDGIEAESKEAAVEIDVLEALFQEVDENGDGELALEELIDAICDDTEGKFEMLKDSAPSVTDRDSHLFFSEIDQDGNGKLNLAEFKEYFYMLKLFHFTDADGSGRVRPGELRAALQSHGHLFPPAFEEAGTSRIAVSALLSVGDLNMDRLLSFREFVHMLLQIQANINADNFSSTPDPTETDVPEADLS